MSHMNRVSYVLATAKTQEDWKRIVMNLEDYIIRVAESAIQNLQTAESLVNQGQMIEAEEKFRTAEHLMNSLQEDGYRLPMPDGDRIPMPPYLEKIRRLVYIPDTLPIFLEDAKQISRKGWLGGWDYLKYIRHCAQECGLSLPDQEYRETMQEVACATISSLLRQAQYAVNNHLHIRDREKGRYWFSDAEVLRKEAEEMGVEFLEDIIRITRETENMLQEPLKIK